MLSRLSWLAASGVSRQFVFLVVCAVLVRRLSPDVFGVFTLGFGATLLLTGLSEFGLRQIGWSEIARRPADTTRVVGQILSARVATGAAAVLLYGLFVASIGRGWSDYLLLGSFAPSLLFNAVAFDFPFLAANRMRELGSRTIVSFTAYAVVTLSTVWEDGQAWIGVAAYSMCNVMLCLSLYRLHRRDHASPRVDLRYRSVKPTLVAAAPLGFNFFVTRIVNNYPILLVGLLSTREAVANYRVAELYYLFVASFGVHLAGAAYSSLAAKKVKSPTAAAGSVEDLLRLAAPAAAACLVACWGVVLPALEWWVGRVSSEGRVAGLILAAGLAPATLSRLLKTCLPGVDLDRSLVLPNVMNVVVGSLGAIALAGPFGLAGVATAVVLAELVCCVLLFAALRRVGMAVRAVPVVFETAAAYALSWCLAGAAMLAGATPAIAGSAATLLTIAAIAERFRRMMHGRRKARLAAESTSDPILPTPKAALPRRVA